MNEQKNLAQQSKPTPDYEERQEKESFLRSFSVPR